MNNSKKTKITFNTSSNRTMEVQFDKKDFIHWLTKNYTPSNECVDDYLRTYLEEKNYIHDEHDVDNIEEIHSDDPDFEQDASVLIAMFKYNLSDA